MGIREQAARSPETLWKDAPRVVAWIAVGVFVLWLVSGVIVPWRAYLPPDSQGQHTPSTATAAPQTVDTQGPRGQLGDQFGLVNSLFTGLALGAVAFSVVMQRREARRLGQQLIEERERHDAQDVALRKEHAQSLYTAKLHALVEHYRVFREEPHYRRARSLTWRCTQRALRDAEFRTYLGKSHSAIHTGNSSFACGHFKDESLLGARDQNNHVYSWNEATHYLDDLLSFFSVFSLHIKAVEQTLPPNDGSKHSAVAAQEFKTIVHQLNIYWDWWSVCVRYVERLRTKADEASTANLAGISTPRYDEEFDRLDRYMFREDFSTRLPATPATSEHEMVVLANPSVQQVLNILNDLNKQEVLWRTCNSIGQEPTVYSTTTPAQPADFSFRDIGVW